MFDCSPELWASSIATGKENWSASCPIASHAGASGRSLLFHSQQPFVGSEIEWSDRKRLRGWLVARRPSEDFDFNRALSCDQPGKNNWSKYDRAVYVYTDRDKESRGRVMFICFYFVAWEKKYQSCTLVMKIKIRSTTGDGWIPQEVFTRPWKI